MKLVGIDKTNYPSPAGEGPSSPPPLGTFRGTSTHRPRRGTNWEQALLTHGGHVNGVRGLRGSCISIATTVQTPTETRCRLPGDTIPLLTRGHGYATISG